MQKLRILPEVIQFCKTHNSQPMTPSEVQAALLIDALPKDLYDMALTHPWASGRREAVPWVNYLYRGF
ncbi:MAG: hypothetical protein ACE5JS_20020 [Nitrospinota bacterium]